MKKNALIIISIFWALVAAAQSTEEYDPNIVNIDGLNFTLDDETKEATIENSKWEGELDIPEQVTYMGKTYSVAYIEWLAFMDCKTLTKVRIPKTLKDTRHRKYWDPGRNPFIRCVNLESIEVDEDNPYMCSVDGVLYNKDMTWLFCYPCGMKRETFSIPEGVVTIGMDAIAGNTALKKVTMPNTVTMAFGSCFDGDINLKEVKLSDNLSSVEELAFLDCKSLKELSIPSSVKSIGRCAFWNCSSLKMLDVPASVTNIGFSAFDNCTLEKLIIRGILKDGYKNPWDIFYGLDKSCVVYVQASVVEECKKEYPGVVLPLEEYATSVPSSNIILRGKKDDIFYDLQGRRISGQPQAGIYVRDGRKVIIR